MKKTVVILVLVLLAFPTHAADLPSGGPGVRICRDASVEALEKLGLSFPQRFLLASFSATVRDAPSTEGKALKRLTGGAEVEALGIVQGSEARNTCEASPYAGCVDVSNAWLEVALPGTPQRRGFLSFINVPAPDALPCPTVPFTGLVGLEALHPENEPTAAPGSTLFDAVGLEHFLALPVLGGRVRLNRRQLELFVRRLPKGRIQYLPPTKETEFTGLKPMLADVALQPALPAFALVESSLVRSDLASLEAMEPVLTWGEQEHYSSSTAAFVGSGEPSHDRMVVFRLPPAIEKAEVLILATPEGARALSRQKPKVTRKKVVRGSKKRQEDIVTRDMVLVDLDGKGGSDLVREYRTIELFVRGEGDSDQVFVRVGFSNAWHVLEWGY